jgi:nicotinamidase-related amidase
MSDQNTSSVQEKLRKIIAPDRAALVIIDMQNDFVSARGKMTEFGFYLGNVQATIKPIQALLQTARALDYPVIHTSMINDVNQNPFSWYTFWGEPAVTLPGSWGAEHIDELKPQKGELTVTKYTYGAFEGTNLNTILRRNGIQTLMLAGTDLNICAGDTLLFQNGSRTQCSASSDGTLHRRESFRYGHKLPAAYGNHVPARGF